MQNKEEMEKHIVAILLDTTQCDDLSCDSMANNPEHLCSYHKSKDEILGYIRTLEASNKELEARVKELEKQIEDEPYYKMGTTGI